jgi:hypothetical protein
MLANISQGSSTQNGIANGMNQNIGIRVTQCTFIMFNLNSSKEKVSTRYQAMYIKPKTDSNGHAKRLFGFFALIH